MIKAEEAELTGLAEFWLADEAEAKAEVEEMLAEAEEEVWAEEAYFVELVEIQDAEEQEAEGEEEEGEGEEDGEAGLSHSELCFRLGATDSQLDALS